MPLRQMFKFITIDEHERLYIRIPFDEADDFANRSAAARRDVAELTVANGLELDGIVEIRTVGRDDDQPSVQFNDA